LHAVITSGGGRCRQCSRAIQAVPVAVPEEEEEEGGSCYSTEGRWSRTRNLLMCFI